MHAHARGNHGPISRGRLEAQRGLGMSAQNRTMSTLGSVKKLSGREKHDGQHEALGLQQPHLLDVAKARNGLG
jgi:hypothetical protein